MNHPSDLILWGATYLAVAAVFFGVIAALYDNLGEDGVSLSALLLASALWPLTLIAALSYTLANKIRPRK